MLRRWVEPFTRSVGRLVDSTRRLFSAQAQSQACRLASHAQAPIRGRCTPARRANSVEDACSSYSAARCSLSASAIDDGDAAASIDAKRNRIAYALAEDNLRLGRTVIGRSGPLPANGRVASRQFLL
jgi:hypothetical protein